MKHILITGGTGRIATCIAEGLRQTNRFRVYRGTRGETAEPDLYHLDYHDTEQMESVLSDLQIHTVIHMGFYMRNDHFVENQIDQNMKNAYYLYEACRRAKVKRVIFGSSNHVFGFYKKGEHIHSDSLYRPDSAYALAKVFVEMLGRYYADRYGLSVFNIRIGNFSEKGNEMPLDKRAAKIWLSNPDCIQLMIRLLDYDENCRYLQMFGMSDNDGCYFDTSDNEKVGYRPESNGAAYLGQLKTQSHFGLEKSDLDLNLLIRHNYVGGYNISMDINGGFDLEYLQEIGKDYDPDEG